MSSAADKKLQLFVATGNKDKIVEIREKFINLNLEIFVPEDLQINFEVEETGTSLEENALLKARAGARASGMLTLADDTGLKVEALDGRPGIYSARFAGNNASYEDNNRLLLEKMSDIPEENRGASFVTVAALVAPGSGDNYTVRGICHGKIASKPSGEKGFGYDPLFYLSGIEMTMAQLSTREKNLISHRARALRKIQILLERHFIFNCC